MRLRVDNDIVRRNIELFKFLLRRTCQKSKSNADIQNKTYQAYINCQTGELLFSDEAIDRSADATDWKLLTFQIHTSVDKKSQIDFSLIEKNLVESEGILKEDAKKILFETVKTIKVISRLLPLHRDATHLFLDFSQVSIELRSKLEKGKDLIHEAWHQVDRVGAEHLLKDKDVGTYIFRKDDFADILQDQLHRAHKKLIKCVTLSFVDHDQKLCDQTLVKTDEGWLVYNDDPTLEEPIYPSIDAYLDNMRGVLKTPLLH